MSTDVITADRDSDYSDEISQICYTMILQVKDIYLAWKTNPKNVSPKFVNDFVPNFVALYYLTSGHIENKHIEDPTVIKNLEDTLYYLDGITGNNGHTIHVSKDSITDGIKKFKDYYKLLIHENLLKVA
jgi:hypothetical protein